MELKKKFFFFFSIFQFFFFFRKKKSKIEKKKKQFFQKSKNKFCFACFPPEHSHFTKARWIVDFFFLLFFCFVFLFLLLCKKKEAITFKRSFCKKQKNDMKRKNQPEKIQKKAEQSKKCTFLCLEKQTKTKIFEKFVKAEFKKRKCTLFFEFSFYKFCLNWHFICSCF